MFRNLKITSIGLLILGAASTGICDVTSATLSRVGSWGNGNFFFQTTSRANFNYYFSIQSDAGKSLLSALLTAYALGKNVGIKADEATGVVTQIWTN